MKFDVDSNLSDHLQDGIADFNQVVFPVSK